MDRKLTIASLLIASMAACGASALAGLPAHHQSMRDSAAASPALLTALYADVPRELATSNAPPRALCRRGDGADAEWACSNWAGTVTWKPSAVVAPESEEELAAFLARLPADSGATLKVVGFAHSWAGIYTPDADAAGNPGATVALHKLKGITKLTASAVEVLAGTSFAQLYAELDAQGLTLAWSPGGIQGLTVGGAVSVGFHGSQLSLGGVSSVVSALRIVGTDGRVHDLTEEANPDEMRAARMGLGMCGVVARVTLPVVPRHHLVRRRWRVDDAGDFLDNQLPALKAEYDLFHYYYHPASKSAWPMYWAPATAEESAAEGKPCRTALLQAEDAAMTEFGPDGLPLIMRWDNCSDVSHKALTHAIDMDGQPLWNGELYVALDDAAEAAAVREIAAAFEALSGGRPNPDIWLHTRYVGGDDGGALAALLNPCRAPAGSACQAFELALVAPAMDAPLPAWEEWQKYFGAMERVLMRLGGAYHHAKYRSPAGTGATPPAPMFAPANVAQFRATCAAFDPAARLRSAAFDRLVAAGTEAAAAAEL